MERELGFGWGLVGLVLGAGAIIGGAMLLLSWTGKRHARVADGAPWHATVVPLADGRAAVVVSAEVLQGGGRYDLDKEIPRLEAFDARDGHELARVVLDRQRYCTRARPGLAWCDTNTSGGTRVELRDAATLAVAHPTAAVLAGAPPVMSDAHAQIDVATAEASIATSDGLYWRVDPKTLAGHAEPARPAHWLDLGPTSDPLDVGVHLAGPRAPLLRFEGQGRQTLMIGERAPTHDVWFDAEFVLDPRAHVALAIDDGRAVLAVHRPTLDRKTAPRQLSAIDATSGAIAWTAPLGQGDVVAVDAVDDLVIVAIRRDHVGELIALGARDGRVRWRTAT